MATKVSLGNHGFFGFVRRAHGARALFESNHYLTDKQREARHLTREALTRKIIGSLG